MQACNRICRSLLVAVVATRSWPLQSTSATALYSILDLGVLAPEQISFGRSINLRGEVAGRAGSLSGTDTRAVLWTLGGIESLGTMPRGDYSAAFDINDFGTVVGSANTATAVRGFRWTRATGMRLLPVLVGDTGSEAFGINNGGTAVGYSSGRQRAVAVRWPADGGVLSLGTLQGGTSSRAFAINSTGQIVGTSTSARWDPRLSVDFGKGDGGPRHAAR